MKYNLLLLRDVMLYTAVVHCRGVSLQSGETGSDNDVYITAYHLYKEKDFSNSEIILGGSIAAISDRYLI